MSKSLPTPNSPLPAKRSFSVTLLVVLVLTFTSLNLARLVESIRLWDLLAELSLLVPFWYLAVSGVFWGVVGLPLSYGLFFGRSWAPRWTRVAALAYTLYYWVDRIFLAQKGMGTVRWPFTVFLTILLLGLTFWVLSRKKVLIFFRHETN